MKKIIIILLIAIILIIDIASFTDKAVNECIKNGVDANVCEELRN